MIVIIQEWNVTHNQIYNTTISHILKVENDSSHWNFPLWFSLIFDTWCIEKNAFLSVPWHEGSPTNPSEPKGRGLHVSEILFWFSFFHACEWSFVKWSFLTFHLWQGAKFRNNWGNNCFYFLFFWLDLLWTETTPTVYSDTFKWKMFFQWGKKNTDVKFNHILWINLVSPDLKFKHHHLFLPL